MPMKKDRYPKNLCEISLRIRKRANWRCELCGVAQGATTKSGGPVVLTVMHLNHDPSDCRDENLKAACQSCHLRYDALIHAQHARETRAAKRLAALQATGQLSLFERSPHD